MTTQLKRLWRIGYWTQNWNDPYHLAPQEFVGRYSADTKRRLVDHLRSGHALIKFCGSSWCRFPQCDARQNGGVELCAGHWTWPSGLAHYVDRHDVLLPAVFVDQVLSGVQSAPEIEHREWEFNVDTTWWMEWCRSNGSGVVRRLMEDLNPRAQREALEAIVKVRGDVGFPLIKKAEDLSTSVCIYQHCQRASLGGLACELRCAEHASDREAGASHFESVARDVYSRYLDLALRRATHEVEEGKHERAEVDKIS